MTTLLNGMIKVGVQIEAIPIGELWLECDNLEDIAVCERLYADLPNRF